MPLQSDEDKRRLAGPGLLVADRWATPKLAEGATTAELVLADKLAPGDLSPTKYYLACRGDGGQVTVVTGSKAAAEPAGLQIVGELLFVARPPQRDAGAVAEAAGMLQL